MKTAHGSNRKSNGIYTIHQRYIALIIAFACFHVLVQVGLQNKCIQQGNYKTTISVHNATTRNRDSFGEGIPLLRHTTIPKSSLPPVTIRHEENYRGSIDPCMEEYKRLVSDRTPGLTTEDMLRSRTYIGNRHRLATLASKFEVAPINAVVCGGSISLGHGVKTTYANRLQEWLNGRFPVSSGNENHKVINKGTHGADICAMAKRTNKLIKELGPDIDLFILEFAVNDYQGQDHVTQIEDRMDTFFDGFRDIASCTESVLVKLLTHYPDAAVIFLEMRTAIIPRKNAAVLHMGAAQHYQVPVISYEQALWPDYMELLEALKPHGYTTLINDTVLPYPHGCHTCDFDGMEDDEMRQDGCQSVCNFQEISGTDTENLDCVNPAPGRQACYVPFLAHDEVHPSGIGHKITSDLIIDAIATTKLDYCHQQHQQPKQRQGLSHYTKQLPKTLLEKKAVFPIVGWMANNPLVMDAQTNFLWVNDTYQMFTDVDELVPSSHTNGFQFLEDMYERWGWIATNEKGNESITFEIDLPIFVSNGEDNNKTGCYIPYLSVLKSYENMGKMTVTVQDRIRDREFTTEIDSLWEPTISVPNDVQLIASGELWYEVEDGCSGNCSITVTSLPIDEGRGGNKIKILTLSVRPCIPREWLEHENFS